MMLALAIPLLLLTGARAHATTATISPAGNILLDGEPFFPIGIYHVSWIGNRMAEKAVPDLHLAADAGFNLFHPTIDFRDSVAQLLDAAEQRGMYVIGEVPLPAGGPDDFINKWKGRAAVIGWNVADDFNAPYAGPAYNHPPADVLALSQHVKSIAPDQLTYASGGAFPGFRIDEFAGTMDLMGFQSYPLGAQNSPDEYALEENMDSFDWVRDQLAGTGQPFIANPQAYKWGGSRYPTPREARNMMYGALLRGAKGILWYTMWEGSDRYLPKTSPALWADLPQQNREVATLVPFLLHGTRTELVTGDARVYATSWQLDGQVLVVALSTERSGATAVALDLPANADVPAHTLFPSRAETGMTVVGGDLTGSIAAEEVHAYLIDLGTPGNAPPVPSFTVAPDGPAFGAPATLDASASSDPGGIVVGWEWDFGDGTRAAGSVVNHTWTAPGTYPVRLTVRDDDGTPRTTIVPVEVGVTALCPPAPLPGCRAGSSTFTLRDPGVDARRTLSFVWKRGSASLAELGDPTAATEVALCVYDANGLALATASQPGSAWDGLGATGYRLRDKTGGAGGLTQARLEPGSGTAASLTLKGKGIKLPYLALPLTPPVTAQLTTSDGGICWQGVYPSGGTTRSTAALFRGKDG